MKNEDALNNLPPIPDDRIYKYGVIKPPESPYFEVIAELGRSQVEEIIRESVLHGIMNTGQGWNGEYMIGGPYRGSSESLDSFMDKLKTDECVLDIQKEAVEKILPKIFNLTSND